MRKLNARGKKVLKSVFQWKISWSKRWTNLFSECFYINEYQFAESITVAFLVLAFFPLPFFREEEKDLSHLHNTSFLPSFLLKAQGGYRINASKKYFQFILAKTTLHSSWRKQQTRLTRQIGKRDCQNIRNILNWLCRARVIHDFGKDWKSKCIPAFWEPFGWRSSEQKEWTT